LEDKFCAFQKEISKAPKNHGEIKSLESLSDKLLQATPRCTIYTLYCQENGENDEKRNRKSSSFLERLQGIAAE
jgi:hypothetical protein